MSKYVEDEKTGNWMLVDDDDQTGTEYDADEHLENLINRVNTWNHEDIRELKDVLDQIHEVLAEAGKAPRTADVIDYSDLPTEPIPAGVETYPVWAMDKKGRCLVGDDATSIENLDDIYVMSENDEDMDRSYEEWEDRIARQEKEDWENREVFGIDW